MTAFRPSGRLRASLYGFVWRVGDMCFRCGNACGHVAAGLLRRDDLRRASRVQWREYGASDDEVDAGLTPFEQRLFSQWLRPAARVLLIGSGAGRDLVGLCRLGFDVTGLEPVPELVERSRQNLERHGLVAAVVPGVVETAPLEQYDAVVWSSFCYSLVHPASARVATLKRLRDCLLPGGRMLVGYITLRSQSRASTFLGRMSARLASADWLPESGDAFTRVHFSPGLLRFEHAFRPGEVERECASAGLRIVGEEICDARTRYFVVEADTLASPFAQS
jgi:SAM-dependent methyltransferase